MEGGLPDLPPGCSPPGREEAALMATNLCSDSSSELSSPMSRSPTPPPELLLRLGPQYPSPPSSQQSSRGTPCPDSISSTCPSSGEDEESRPVKRRRVTPAMHRDTKRLDLHELSVRPDSDQQLELDRLLKVLRRNRKIVVVAGAGISVSAGIPDFRSSTGLFNSLKAQHNLKGSGKELFDAAVYRDNTSTTSFHQMVRSLSGLTKSAKPTPFHHLLARLAHDGRLLRLYTQNVDGIDTSLEPLATQVPLPTKGPWPKTIQLHGGLEKMTCTKCHHLSNFEADLFDGPVPPECPQCRQEDFARTEVAGKRSHGIGRLRPRMVLYNEHNPDDEAIGAVTKADLRRRPDAIIVVGTTLKIPGVKRIVREMCSIVRNHRDGLAVWINNDPEPTAKEFENCWDLIIKGTCDEVAQHAAMRNWDVEDDEIGEAKVVTEEDIQLAKDKGLPQVIVNTTPKLDRIKSLDGLPTPAHTPRLVPSATNDEAGKAESKPAKAGSKITLNFSRTDKSKPETKTAAAKQKNAAPRRKGRPPKKTDDGLQRQPSAAKKQQDVATNTKLPFKVKKATSSANLASDVKAQNGDFIKVLPPLRPKEPVEPQFQSPMAGSNADRHGMQSKFENSTTQTLPPGIPAQLAALAFQTPKKPMAVLDHTPSIERPPVSPFTPTRPIASPFTGCKKLREPLSPSSFKDNVRPQFSLFPNLVKPLHFPNLTREQTS